MNVEHPCLSSSHSKWYSWRRMHFHLTVDGIALMRPSIHRTPWLPVHTVTQSRWYNFCHLSRQQYVETNKNVQREIAIRTFPARFLELHLTFSFLSAQQLAAIHTGLSFFVDCVAHTKLISNDAMCERGACIRTVGHFYLSHIHDIRLKKWEVKQKQN